MKKKAVIVGVVFIVLILPVLFFLLLSSGEQHYVHLPYYGLRSYSAAIADTVYHQVPAYRLTAQDGEPFHSSELKGRIYVASFISTTCSGTCSKVTTQLKQVQKKLDGANEVQLLSVSLEPEHDSLADLQHYASRHGADPNIWTFLTGNPDTIQWLAREGYLLEDLPISAASHPSHHPDQLVLIDKEGHIRGYYHGSDPQDVSLLMDEIGVLSLEYAE